MATLTTASTSSGGVSVAFDYSTDLAAINASLASITPTLNNINASLVNIGTYLNGIDTSLNRVANYMQTVSTLSTTTGIRLHGAHEYTPMLDLYDWYIVQKNELKVDTFTSTEFVNFIRALSSITNYMPRFK